MLLHDHYTASTKDVCEELNLSEDVQTFIDHDDCRGTALSSAGACMLNTRIANLNLVGDHSTRLENTTYIFITEGNLKRKLVLKKIMMIVTMMDKDHITYTNNLSVEVNNTF